MRENPTVKSKQLFEPYVRPWDQVYRTALEADPEAGAPDPNCEDCDRTGFLSCYTNPDARWDWYQIGRRYTGVLSGCRPTENPATWERCPSCSGEEQSEVAGTDPGCKW